MKRQPILIVVESRAENPTEHRHRRKTGNNDAGGREPEFEDVVRGPTPFATAFRARCLRLRARSSARTAATFASRNAFCCAPHRNSLHAFPHVICVFATDGSGTYQSRHMQHRRRGIFLWVFTHRPLPSRSSLPTLPRHPTL